MILATILWLLALTAFGLFLYFRGTHHRTVINRNAEVLNRLGRIHNNNVDMVNANSRTTARALHELEINAHAGLDAHNANVETAQYNFGKARDALSALKNKIDNVKHYANQRFNALSEDLGSLVEAAQASDHGIDAVDARVTLVHNLVSEELNRLRAALGVIVTVLREPAFASEDSEDSEGLKTADAIEAALGSFPETTIDVSDLPKEIQTSHGPAFLVEDTNVYSRPKPDGEKGNYYFNRHGVELDWSGYADDQTLDKVFEIEHTDSDSNVQPELIVTGAMVDEYLGFPGNTHIPAVPTEAEVAAERQVFDGIDCYSRAHYTRTSGTPEHAFRNLRDGIFVGYVPVDGLVYYDASGKRVDEKEAELSDPPVAYAPPSIDPAPSSGGYEDALGTGDNQVVGGDTAPRPLTQEELDDMPF